MSWRQDLTQGLKTVASIYQMNFMPTPHDFDKSTERFFKPWHWVDETKEQGEYDSEGAKHGRVVTIDQNSFFFGWYDHDVKHGKYVYFSAYFRTLQVERYANGVRDGPYQRYKMDG